MATNDVLLNVGETLVTIIRSGVASVVPAPDVLVTTTDQIIKSRPVEPGVTVFLYNISSNTELRNAPPSVGFNRPRLALDLRYLITPWSSDPGTAHQICGLILQTFYDHANLVRGDLTGNSWSADDTLQILLESLPVSEHHYIWEPAEIPYRLSLAYLVRVIGLDPSVPAATEGIVATTTMGGPS